MTTTIHLTQHFATKSQHIFDECDRLMQALGALEEIDPSVRDAAVSADAELGLVEIEVIAEGIDEDEAIAVAVSRIRAGVTQVTQVSDDDPIQIMRERDRTQELVTC